MAKEIKRDFFHLLACPKCKGPVELTPKEEGLVCKKCKLLYEIRRVNSDQECLPPIPVMLIEEAIPLEQ